MADSDLGVRTLNFDSCIGVRKARSLSLASQALIGLKVDENGLVDTVVEANDDVIA